MDVVEDVEEGVAARVVPSSRTKTPSGLPERRVTASGAESPTGGRRRQLASRRRRVAAGGAESPSGSAGWHRVAEQRHQVLQVVLSHQATAPGGAEGPNGSAEWSAEGVGWSTGGAEGPRVGAGAAAGRRRHQR